MLEIERSSRHLVRARYDVTPSALLGELRAAHRYLVAAARETVPRLLDLRSDFWGSAGKREHVVLPGGDDRPDLVSKTIERHAFIEVLNQCATLERLIDTLEWAAQRDELQTAMVTACHPTTSSAPRKTSSARDPDDHDLVLRDGTGQRWKFEVSDVAGSLDRNDKERQDLNSLGIFWNRELPSWPEGRLFLAVSIEFATRLQRPTGYGLRSGVFHYHPVKSDGHTWILEARQGPDPARASPGKKLVRTAKPRTGVVSKNRE